MGKNTYDWPSNEWPKTAVLKSTKFFVYRFAHLATLRELRSELELHELSHSSCAKYFLAIIFHSLIKYWNKWFPNTCKEQRKLWLEQYAISHSSCTKYFLAIIFNSLIKYWNKMTSKHCTTVKRGEELKIEFFVNL